MRRSSKGFVPILIILTVILLGFGAFLIFKNQWGNVSTTPPIAETGYLPESTLGPISADLVDLTNNWKEYKSNDGVIYFKYPEDLFIFEEKPVLIESTNTILYYFNLFPTENALNKYKKCSGETDLQGEGGNCLNMDIKDYGFIVNFTISQNKTNNNPSVFPVWSNYQPFRLGSSEAAKIAYAGTSINGRFVSINLVMDYPPIMEDYLKRRNYSLPDDFFKLFVSQVNLFPDTSQ